MNVGYSKFGLKDVDLQVCPICGKNIYVYKRGCNYACTDFYCPLGNGATELIEKVNKIITMMK